MSGISLPVSRPVGHALVVGTDAYRPRPLGTLRRLGYQCQEQEDPYAAIAELARRPMVYRALILSLNSLFQEEMQLVETVKRRFPHIEIWLCDTDGRQAALADALRLGADGLLGDEGLHRVAVPQLGYVPPAPVPTIVRTVVPDATPEPAPVVKPRVKPPAPEIIEAAHAESNGSSDPLLSADELRALLDDPTPSDVKTH